MSLLPAVILLGTISGQALITTVAGRERIKEGASGSTQPLRVSQLAADAAGNVYFTYTRGVPAQVYKLTNQGRIYPVFSGNSDDVNYCPPYSGDGRSPLDTAFCNPYALAVDSEGSLYVSIGGFAVPNGHRVIKVRSGIVTTVAGNGIKGVAGDKGDPLKAQLGDVNAIAVDSAGAVYVNIFFGNLRRIANGQIDSIPNAYGESLATDGDRNLYYLNQNRIWKWSPTTGRAVVFAGQAQAGFSPDGTPAAAAALNRPAALATGPDGIYFLELGSQRIRKIADGVIKTVAGSGQQAYAGEDAPALAAPLDLAGAMAIDFQGSIYFTESQGLRIRKLANGRITTIAGNGRDLAPPPVREDSDPVSEHIPAESVAVDTTGNVYMVSGETYSAQGTTILRLNAQTNRITTVAGVMGQGGHNGEGLAGRQTQISPLAIATGPDGSVYFVSQYRIRKLQNGVVSTVAGTGRGFGLSNPPCPPFLDRVPALQANFCLPEDLAVDSLGNIYVADRYFRAIVKVDVSTGLFSMVANDLAANSVAVSPKGEVFASTGSPPRGGGGPSFGIYRIADGRATLVAGMGQTVPDRDGTPALQAFIYPKKIAVDGQDNVYFTEFLGTRVRLLSLATGLISNPIGGGIGGYNGDSVPANTARVWMPDDLCFDAAGNLYIADGGNGRIRKVHLARSASLTSAGGNGQRILQNQRAPVALRVSANMGDGRPLPNATIGFRLVTGQAVLSAASTVTGVDGGAEVSLTATLATGRVVVEATSTGLPATQFHIDVIPLPAPVISAGGVASAGLSNPPQRRLTPGGIATVFGRYFRILETSRNLSGQDIVDGRVPDKLDDVCVVIGTKRAHIYNIYPGQINFQVPDLPTGTHRLLIITGCDTPNGLFSNEEPVAIGPISPEFLYLLTAADGKQHIAAVKADGTLVGPRGAVKGVETEPARGGETIVIYALGLGGTSPPVPPGTVATQAAAVSAAVRFTIAGSPVPASRIHYIGLTPGFAGLYQINATVPEGVPRGDALFSLMIGTSIRADGYLSVE